MRKFLSLVLIAAMAMGVMSLAPTLAFAAKSADERFKDMDKDSSGDVSVDEFTAGKSGKQADKAKEMFTKLDANSDGKLTLDEFKAAAGKKGKKKE